MNIGITMTDGTKVMIEDCELKDLPDAIQAVRALNGTDPMDYFLHRAKDVIAGTVAGLRTVGADWIADAIENAGCA